MVAGSAASAAKSACVVARAGSTVAPPGRGRRRRPRRRRRWRKRSRRRSATRSRRAPSSASPVEPPAAATRARHSPTQAASGMVASGIANVEPRTCQMLTAIAATRNARTMIAAAVRPPRQHLPDEQDEAQQPAWRSSSTAIAGLCRTMLQIGCASVMALEEEGLQCADRASHRARQGIAERTATTVAAAAAPTSRPAQEAASQNADAAVRGRRPTARPAPAIAAMANCGME